LAIDWKISLSESLVSAQGISGHASFVGISVLILVSIMKKILITGGAGFIGSILFLIFWNSTGLQRLST